jgi:hypothetical protein
MVNPNLADAAARQKANPSQDLAPRLFLFLVARDQAHYVIKQYQIDSAELGDYVFYALLSGPLIERL